MAASKQIEFVTMLSLAEAMQRAQAVLNQMGASNITSSIGMVKGETLASLKSAGETITAMITVRFGGKGGCHLLVTSTSRISTTLVDWGRNQENVREFERLFLKQDPTFMPPGTYSADVISRLAQDSALNPLLNVPAPAEPAAPPIRIFISYRRDDSRDVVGRIRDRLVRDLGEANIFRDVDSIPYGVDFVEYLTEQVERATVLLAIIGPHWLTIADKAGRRRLDDPNDFVRVEIASALRRQIRVVPVLLGDTVMPSAADLPPDLQLLARRNGTHVRPDPDFHTDLDRLISRLG